MRRVLARLTGATAVAVGGGSLVGAVGPQESLAAELQLKMERLNADIVAFKA